MKSSEPRPSVVLRIGPELRASDPVAVIWDSFTFLLVPSDILDGAFIRSGSSGVALSSNSVDLNSRCLALGGWGRVAGDPKYGPVSSLNSLVVLKC